MSAVAFSDSEPRVLALASTASYTFSDRYQNPRVRWQLVGGDVLFTDVPTGSSLRGLELEPGESFGICKHRQGRRVIWDVWLTPETEKARAEREKPAIASLLREPLTIGRGPGKPTTPKRAPVLPMPAKRPETPGTGTYGPAPAPKPAAGGAVPQKIPFNVAFREAVILVNCGLEANREQWNDEARQAAVSTILIAASKAGWLTVWERPAA